MSKPPLPREAVELLVKPNPALIAILHPDGQPVSAATWYLWEDGRVMVNMDEGRRRLEQTRQTIQRAVDASAELASRRDSLADPTPPS